MRQKFRSELNKPESDIAATTDNLFLGLDLLRRNNCNHLERSKLHFGLFSKKNLWQFMLIRAD